MINVKEVLSILTKRTLDNLARKTEFIKRQNILTAFDFYILITVGQLGMKHPSLGGMVDAIKSKISRESLHERFSAGAVAYLESCAKIIFKKKLNLKQCM